MSTAVVRPVAIKIDDDIKARVKRLAEATIKAWEDFRLTGLHVSAAEADAWLAELEQGKDLEPPECHV